MSDRGLIVGGLRKPEPHQLRAWKMEHKAVRAKAVAVRLPCAWAVRGCLSGFVYEECVRVDGGVREYVLQRCEEDVLAR